MASAAPATIGAITKLPLVDDARRTSANGFLSDVRLPIESWRCSKKDLFYTKRIPFKHVSVCILDTADMICREKIANSASNNLATLRKNPNHHYNDVQSSDSLVIFLVTSPSVNIRVRLTFMKVKRTLVNMHRNGGARVTPFFH